MWTAKALQPGEFRITDMEARPYSAAVDPADGGLSAAARLLGLSRAQLAYKPGQRRPKDRWSLPTVNPLSLSLSIQAGFPAPRSCVFIASAACAAGHPVPKNSP